MHRSVSEGNGMSDASTMQGRSNRVMVLGIGNVLMSDEGVGCHAIKRLIERYDIPDEVEILDGGTTGMELLPLLEEVDELIVVDAVRCGKPPASIVLLEGSQVPVYFKTKISPHQVGLSDVLASLAFKGSAPRRVVLIGVQPLTLDLAMELSPEVEARLDDVASMIAVELAKSEVPARLRA